MTQRRKAATSAAAESGEVSASSSSSGARKPNPGDFKKNDPRINRTIPGPGRQTDRFKNWCRKLIANPKRRKQVRRVLNNANHPAYSAMWKEVAAHGHGKPTQNLEIGLDQGLAERLKLARQRSTNKGE